LAEETSFRLSQRLSPSRVAQVRASIKDALITATKGEDVDILFEDVNSVDEEAAIEMTEQKSGALVAMAFRLAASVATDDKAILKAVAEFGTQVGTISQLENDAQACTRDLALAGTDLRLRKKTLPVAYALQCARSEDRQDFLAHFEKPRTKLSQRQILDMQGYIAECGGLHYAWTVCEAVRHRAAGSLEKLGRLIGTEVAEGLKNLIPPLRPMESMG
ncbi:MAG TPA: polyprenyl synthetase family protein, partial [Chloroflexota bacterium]|nr:polyprenyl synthetase family protein [Chloroflexota bacterium]